MPGQPLEQVVDLGPRRRRQPPSRGALGVVGGLRLPGLLVHPVGAHPLAARKRLRVPDLDGLDLVVHAEGRSVMHDAVIELCREAGFEARVRHEVTETSTLVTFVAAELGAARIQPVQTDHTNSERIRQDRLQAHAVEAAEQCGGTFVPPVADLVALSRLLDSWDGARRILWADEALVGPAETLAGLSGFGDLVLTCTSLQSRNFRYGHALGSGAEWDASTTVEGIATARAMAARAAREGVDMPVVSMIVALIDGRVTVTEAAERLLNRPLKEE